MQEDSQIDHLCFCRDSEFCNESLIHFSKCRNLDSAIKTFPILQTILCIYNNPNIDLNTLNLPLINLKINIDIINKINKKQQEEELIKNTKHFMDFINYMNGIKLKTFIKCLCTTFIFDQYFNNFWIFYKHKKIINVMYSKLIEFINSNDVYETFNFISKLYKQDENILDKFRKMLEPYLEKEDNVNPKQ